MEKEKEVSAIFYLARVRVYFNLQDRVFSSLFPPMTQAAFLLSTSFLCLLSNSNSNLTHIFLGVTSRAAGNLACVWHTQNDLCLMVYCLTGFVYNLLWHFLVLYMVGWNKAQF